MKHSFIKLVAFSIISLALLAGCQSPNLPTGGEVAKRLDWNDFYAGAVQEAEIDGQTKYLIEGDILASSLSEVQAYYDSLNLDAADGSRATVNVIRINGGRYADIYNTTVRGNLKYKIAADISSTVRSDLQWALAQWEAYAGVDFIDVSGSSQTAVFTIRNATQSEENALPGVIASAFFPSYSDKTLILFNDFYSLFANGSFYGWDQKAVLLHELGHGLGLRHEFIWTKSWYGSSWYQSGETSAEAYLMSAKRDDYSIMYYPQYSAYKGNGRLSSEDRTWIKWLYPLN
ncbi:MAG: matrixin family metalloprotease [Spirochaetes bacterium]|nr:matrixin family metalloprotease [Spirochaetota bacterium]MBU0957117.1 matrixin family metalloprotease [Spirochaetota bacterium]